MTQPILADPEAVVIAWLNSITGVTATVSDRIATQLEAGAYPQIRVTRVGGTVDDPWRDVPRVQVEFWGGSPQDGGASPDVDVSLLARTAVASIRTLHGPLAGGYATSAYVSVGPFPSPDPVTDRSRQIVEVTFDLETP